MTSPVERTRSLNRCRGLLKALSDRAHLCPNGRANAAALLVDYPTADDLSRWIRKPVTTIPSEAANAISSAGALLRRLLRQGGLPEMVSREIDAVLSHFPDAGAAKLLVLGLLPMPIGRWLARDRDAHADPERGQARCAIPSVVDLALDSIGNAPAAQARRLAIAAAELHQANADGLLLTHVAGRADHWETLQALVLAEDLLARVLLAASDETALAADIRWAIHRLQLAN